MTTNLTNLSIEEIARSIELYKLGKKIHEEGKKGISRLVLTKEPLLRDKSEIKRLIVAAGSYDPLTVAHVSLFRKGLEAVRRNSGNNGLEETLIITSTAHFEKVINLMENAAIYDRVHSQEGFATCEGNVSLGFFNKALFVEMAASIQVEYPNAQIYFVVGTDVMKKVLDPVGYKKINIDYRESQERLFNSCSFIVSQRYFKLNGKSELIKLDDLLTTYPESMRYAHNMIGISLETQQSNLKIPIERVSSSLIRNKRNKREDISKLVAVGISRFVDRRSLYLTDSDKYAASVCARERYADEHSRLPITEYIDELMSYLGKLDKSPELRRQEVTKQKVI